MNTRRRSQGQKDLFTETEPVTKTTFTEKEAPSAAMSALLSKTRKRIANRKKKPKTIAVGEFNRALLEVDTMLRTGDWSDATTRHMVALYDRMHERTYGVEALELGPTERFNALMLASNMLKTHFSGDLEKMVPYMLWVWNREVEREAWRRRNQQSGQRIGVRLMFSGSMLTDYRVDLARRPKQA